MCAVSSVKIMVRVQNTTYFSYDCTLSDSNRGRSYGGHDYTKRTFIMMQKYCIDGSYYSTFCRVLRVAPHENFSLSLSATGGTAECCLRSSARGMVSPDEGERAWWKLAVGQVAMPATVILKAMDHIMRQRACLPIESSLVCGKKLYRHNAIAKLSCNANECLQNGRGSKA